ncbi:MAG: tripartite tricarboxylate transporter TctB family protein [Thermodesulfobacteriota bacterium]
MRWARRAFSFALTLLSVAYLYFVWRMDVGNLLEPGPGFMPAVVGSMALVASFLIFLGTLKGKAEKDGEKVPAEGMWRFAACVAAIAVFIPLFTVLGSLISIFIIVFLMNKILGAKGWVQPLVLALACSAVTYVLFVLMLDVPLPRGIL